MTPYYLTIPVSRKPEIPPSLLPSLRTGHCSGCGREVVYHGTTFDRWLLATQAANQVEEFIRHARDVMQPSEVELHHVPNWFRRALLKAFGCDCGDSRGDAVLRHAIAKLQHSGYASWLDHWGSTRYSDGTVAFVSEPYDVSPAAVRQIDEIVRRIGAAWHLSSNSWWYPGRTIRIAIEPRKD